MVHIYDFPEDGELVVCTVNSVKNYGAFVSLDEYEGKEGFIHVRDVATGWVKYIRDYVREGQKVVCKVLSVDRAKGHVDLSLKQVNEHQKREKIQQWKNEKKAEKLVEIVASQLKKSREDIKEDILTSTLDKYGAVYTAFEAAALDEKSFRKEMGKKRWVDAFVGVAQENIQPPKVEIAATMELTCFDPSGIIHIRNAILENLSSESAEVGVSYMGAPKYRIVLSAKDYKTAEDQLKKVFEGISADLQARGGNARLVRE